MNRGSVIVYFGNGKGKSSSAIGHAICAAGMGQSVAIIQFLKGNNQKEIEFLKRLEPEVRLFTFEKNTEFFEELNEEQVIQVVKLPDKTGVGDVHCVGAVPLHCVESSQLQLILPII